MIVASLLLIAVAAVLLVLGLLRDIDLLLVVSIAVSLVAAVALYLGARQSRSADREDASDEDDRPAESRDATGEPSQARGRISDLSRAHAGSGPRRPIEEHPDWPLRRRASRDASEDELDEVGGRRGGREAVTASLTRYRDVPADRGDDAVTPSDEPPAQRTPRSDAELIARLPAEVLVVDGRPRYHVSGCPHLLDREAEPLPVSEAAELGFSPCGWCQPDTVLLGGTPDG